MKAIVAAVHGILSGQTDPAWPEKLDAWSQRFDGGLHVIFRRYHAAPLPWWNVFAKDPWLARGLAGHIELLLGNGPLCADGSLPPVWFVAHSNGAVIALRAARRLIARGFKVAGVIFIGAAIEADVQKNGILDWWRAEKLGSALAYSSEDDEVVAGDGRAADRWGWRVRDAIWGRLMWPYGSLGRTGWVLADGHRREEFGAISGPRRILTRWHRGGHSSYFSAGKMNATFEEIYADISA